MYLSFVRPLVEYGAELWDPYLQRDIKTIERVQQFACKVIFRGGNWNGSYHDMIEQLGIPTLQRRRTYLKLCTFYKIIKGYFFFNDLY